MRSTPPRPLLLLALGSMLLVATACTSESTDASEVISVRSTSDACEVEVAEAPSGILVFEVTNDGAEVTEFYLYAADGVEVISEIENIGPGITRNLMVRAAPGDYITACKPGMVGDGIRSAFTVTE